jgi:hypothetical protein
MMAVVLAVLAVQVVAVRLDILGMVVLEAVALTLLVQMALAVAQVAVAVLVTGVCLQAAVVVVLEFLEKAQVELVALRQWVVQVDLAELQAAWGKELLMVMVQAVMAVYTAVELVKVLAVVRALAVVELYELFGVVVELFHPQTLVM